MTELQINNAYAVMQFLYNVIEKNHTYEKNFISFQNVENFILFSYLRINS